MRAEGAAPAVVWFRNDLRLGDNPALRAAADTGVPLLCIYVHDEVSPGLRPLGGASRWWLHHALDRLSESLSARGSRLDLFRGASVPALEALFAAVRPRALYFNRRYQHAEIALDNAVRAAAARYGAAVHDFSAELLHEPQDIEPKSGGFFRVFSPYLRAALARESPMQPLTAPSRLAPSPQAQHMDAARTLAGFDLLPRISWDAGLAAAWKPGEEQARAALDGFIRAALATYPTGRDQPGQRGSSRLSPHLRFGEISPRQVVAAIAASDVAPAAREKFLAELHWRDFTRMLLFHRRDLAERPFQQAFASFPYAELAPAEWRAWTRGRTGYPIVDAGMRDLWQTGFMPNRVRMITASFLVKHLQADWRRGEAWFWDTLCDADPGNNPVNWQWIAGCGIDPVPYFRVFNPVLQGETYDPEGSYVRRFVPELAALPDRWLHKPWKAPRSVLEEAGVELGNTYPRPIVDHAKARARALETFRRFRAERVDPADARLVSPAAGT